MEGWKRRTVEAVAEVLNLTLDDSVKASILIALVAIESDSRLNDEQAAIGDCLFERLHQLAPFAADTAQRA